MPTLADKWDAIYADQQCHIDKAATVLQQNLHLLPANGVALDVACGLGGNAILLAQQGLNSHAWDVSPVALDKINDYAKQNNVTISTSLRDVESNPPAARSVDVLVVSCFLCRTIMADLRASLKKGGLLFYQTFSVDKVSQSGPSNPDYLLTSNELLSCCDGMKILVYREEGLQGDTQTGWRNQAMIIAQQLD